MQQLIQKAASRLAQAKQVVIFTGAGVSQESGVPTFRDVLEGLWAKYDPARLATPQAFKADPKLVWDFYAYRRKVVEGTSPNPGHYAIAELENLLPKVVLITQNVDNLHQLAGSQDIVTLHGSLFTYKCSQNCQGNPTPIDLSALDVSQTPPPCPFCGLGLTRPDVVWFGEALPLANLDRAFHEAETCDAMIVVGTSGAVYPAARLPFMATDQGAFIIEVNPRKSEITSIANAHFQASSAVALPQLVEAVRQELA
jgi:NAD-dependent deacetylase